MRLEGWPHTAPVPVAILRDAQLRYAQLGSSERENVSFWPENFVFDGLGNTGRNVFRLIRRPRGENQAIPIPNAKPMPAALCGGRRLGLSGLCRRLGLGVQREEAHHVASDREPQQMDAGLDFAAQG